MHRPSYPRIGALLLFLALAAGLLYQYQRPIPAVSVSGLIAESSIPQAAPVTLPWPARGSAAVAVEGRGLGGPIRADAPRPIASVTKLMTAYVILKDKPLKQGDAGPTVRVTALDIRTYNESVARDESVVLVSEGQNISEYDLLQGLLIASGNNFAVMLARWDAGSIEAFVQKMNAEAAALGMKSTRYADPGGASAASQSTASDQLILAQLAMANPVVREIVAKKQSVLPVAGTIGNTNMVLGQGGIIGGKTGWTEEAGGCLLWAANAPSPAGGNVLVYGVVLGQEVGSSNSTAASAAAARASVTLAPAVGQGVQKLRVVAQNAPTAAIASQWGGETRALAGSDVDFLIWPGMAVQSTLDLQAPPVPIAQGVSLGTLNVRAGNLSASVPLRAEKTLASPSILWRLTRR